MHQSHHQQAIHIDVCSIRISLSISSSPYPLVYNTWQLMCGHVISRIIPPLLLYLLVEMRSENRKKKWPITQAWSVTKNRIPWASKNPWQLQLTIFGGGTSTLWVYFFIYSIGNNLVDFKSICGEWMGGGADLCTHRSKKTEEQIVAKEVEKIVMQWQVE
jgi:hypothetical protein